MRVKLFPDFTHHHLINWFLSNQITSTCSSLPVFFFKSKKSKISGCQGSKYIAKAPGRLFPPWSTYLAVALKTRSMGTRPFEVPLVWVRQDKTRQDTCTSYKKMNVTKVCWINYLYTFNFSNDKLFSCQLRLTLYTNKKNYKYLKFRSLDISVTDRMIISKMLVQHETFSKLLTNMLTVKLIIIRIIIIITSTTATLGTGGCYREVTI